ncbi:glycoside hydrolase family 78 protein [candidate division KSB1 bacterium]|nr:glycoside hydrolase family 78 protein [candidate division KSB1 bacterium]MBL7093913.1 glycoside hydrolase family 78 protein [candidate division KSB1 bacterium]
MISISNSKSQSNETNFKKVEGIHADYLRCEYLRNPLGIDVTKPRFSWILESNKRDQKQSAYQILMASSKEKLDGNKGDLWDSGKIESDKSIQIVYNGKPLQSKVRCFWKVQVWDKNGEKSDWSDTAMFTMGLLENSDWEAEWIGAPKENPEIGKKRIPPSPLLRKSFAVSEEMDYAYLYVTSLGDYELRLNGKKVGNHVLAPEWTDYLKRVQYQTYDVTEFLSQGENVIGAVLADGWYAGRLGPVRWDKNYPRRGPYGLDRRLLMRLDVVRKDGNVQTIVSDGSWKIFLDGPIRSADNFLGETYDTRKEQPNWDKPGFDDSKWESITVDKSMKANLVAQMNEPIRIVKNVKPIEITEPKPVTYIFNMGQNMAGWCRIRLDGPAGKEITLRHGEMLNLDGTLHTENLKSAVQIDKFILDGKGEKDFEPRFTYHGFQYVEVTGLTSKPSLDMLVGKAVASDPPITSKFECSNEMLNKLMQNIVWSQRGNMHSVPTDCPQRDERMGWMGDAMVFAQTSIYNMDMAAFYTKWITDIRDAQTKDGRYPDFAPHPYEPEKRFSDVPGWADAGVVVPWRLYQNYGDKRILKEHYPSAVRFIENIISNNPDFIWKNGRGNKYSDWLNGNTIKAEGYPEKGGEVPYLLYTTTMFANSCRILSKMAAILDRENDVKRYEEILSKIKHRFVEEFLKEDGKLEGDTQAGYALALYYDLLPPEYESKAAELMNKQIERYDGRISTGFHSTIPLMKELTKMGYNEVAYKLIESERLPSWGYSIKQGATTTWERWDAFVAGRGFQNPGMNSFNHYAFGAVGEWMYENLLGIKFDERNPGFKHFVIHPKPGGSLKWAKGEYNSIRGKIGVDWQIKDNKIYVKVEVPPNTNATIHLQTNDSSQVLESGKPVGQVKGVHKITKLDKKLELQVGSGKYDFEALY